jgi:nucleoside-diphosphate-sugar epimerase
MNILVTGSNGFLATYFSNNNKLENCKILYGSTKNSKSYLTFEKLYSNVSDILMNKRINVIIHFASVIPKEFNLSSYDNTFLPNTKMMNNLMSYSLENNVEKFIYISSFGSMYYPNSFDIKDFYTMSKISGEHFCSMMENRGIETASLRLSSPYGEYSHSNNVLNKFIKEAINNELITVHGTGKREQNFIYVGDVTRVIELCIKKKIKGVYNLVSSSNISMVDLAHLIVKITGSKSEIIINNQHDPQEEFQPNYDYIRIKNELSYTPKFDLEPGLIKYIDWLSKNENSINI